MFGEMRPRSQIWNLPNGLTVFRVLLIVPFMAFMYLELEEPGAGSLWAFVIFVTAAITDLVDGQLARRFDAVTPLGKLLDPLADKLLVTAALVMLAVYDGVSEARVGAPAWMAVVIIARELAVTGLRGMAGAEGIVIQASSGGKWKTVLQLVALCGLILQGMRETVGPVVEIMGTAVHIGLVTYWALWVALILTAWSGIAYFQRFLLTLLRNEQLPTEGPKSKR